MAAFVVFLGRDVTIEIGRGWTLGWTLERHRITLDSDKPCILPENSKYRFKRRTLREDMQRRIQRNRTHMIVFSCLGLNHHGTAVFLLSSAWTWVRLGCHCPVIINLVGTASNYELDKQALWCILCWIQTRRRYFRLASHSQISHGQICQNGSRSDY